MHRVLDLAILLCRTNLYFRDEAYRHPRYYDPEHPRIDRVGLQGDAMDIEVCTENPMLEEDIRLFYNVLGEDGELLGEPIFRSGPAAAGDGILIPERGLF